MKKHFLALLLLPLAVLLPANALLRLVSADEILLLQLEPPLREYYAYLPEMIRAAVTGGCIVYVARVKAFPTRGWNLAAFGIPAVYLLLILGLYYMPLHLYRYAGGIQWTVLLFIPYAARTLTLWRKPNS